MAASRVMFWQIDHVWLFYVLAAVATILFLSGLALHILVWRKSSRSREISFKSDALKKCCWTLFWGDAS